LDSNPLADVWIAIRQCNAGAFALSEKSNAFLAGQSHIFEVEEDPAVFPFRADERFQFGNVLFVDPAEPSRKWERLKNVKLPPE
jgi:hypothetical protein